MWTDTSPWSSPGCCRLMGRLDVTHCWRHFLDKTLHYTPQTHSIRSQEVCRYSRNMCPCSMLCFEYICEVHRFLEECLEARCSPSASGASQYRFGSGLWGSRWTSKSRPLWVGATGWSCCQSEMGLPAVSQTTHPLYYTKALPEIFH